ncbi:amino acid ABC transporter [Aliidongia dinghuensis]|uniref:Amino acid ABC transporter n=1 Tax=Aliidongia dinghuensis TaxID=1867774 RepID=A0A8J2YZK0_9PROT|nr:amino acid ABC transporter permease [Aliidongia dinghuensis]GGF43296.1 amino acid ABC transporter [Aliidongia dinghuensis]
MAFEEAGALPRPRRLPTGRLAVVAGVVLAASAAWVAGLEMPALLSLMLQWLPHLAMGFALNVAISLGAVGLGTAAGTALALMELSSWVALRLPAEGFVTVFRNAPILVVLFATTYVFPFEISLGPWHIAFPDWAKAMIGLALPAASQVAELLRGAIQSIPSAQWDAAASLAFTRSQSFRWIILPQCAKRALPPWMNLYSTIAMATTLASLVGVHDLLEAATEATTAVQRMDFTVAVYLAVLGWFFVYCYPIARFVRWLERRLDRR